MRKIHKSVPQTESERYLSDLCSRSFLSLWSYPGVYRDQAGTGGEGKEVCDLLVVFGRHIIIFSDKYCSFDEESPVELAWSRWFRKTIESSATQVFGAERWIRNFPSRLFLDRKCTQHFPMALPKMSEAVFHRIVVAHGISEPFRKIHGGSGSLMLLSDIVGNQHYDTPFMVGWVGEQSKRHVHVFDDTTLDIVMRTLDTITDFIWYLEKKEKLFASSTKVSAAGEEELLAYYLGHLDAEGHHEFSFPNAYDAVAVTEGHWADFLDSEERAAQTEADKISYAWDALIEKFSHHVMEGTQYEAAPAGVDDQEKIFRFMAREPRTRRRMLAKALLEKIATTPSSHWGMRLMLPSTKGDPYYVFLAFPRSAGQSEHEYRTARRELLINYCIVTKLEHNAAEEIVGIATEEGVDTYPRTEDAIYYDAREWTAADEAGARKIQKELGLLKRVTMRKTTEYEYPDVPARWSGSVSRNSPCPCGSRKRYKRCHGALKAG